jgi:peptide deformylase
MDLDITNNFLYTNCQEWDFQNPPFDLSDFGISMVSFMLEKNGLGLSANQVGYSFRIFAMRGTPENFVLINPRIVSLSGEAVELQEACLSYPGLIVSKERMHHCRVRFQGIDGNTYTRQFTGITSRVVQHEMNHINGEPFWTGVSKLKFDRALKKAYKNGHTFNNVTYKGR